MVTSDQHWGQNAPWHRTPSILANSKERNDVLYKTDLSWWGKPVTKKIGPPFTILAWFKNIYICKPMSNSMTGHHMRLIWAPSRICEQGWRELWKKLGAFSLWKTAMLNVHLCQRGGMKFLHFSVRFNPPSECQDEVWSVVEAQGLLSPYYRCQALRLLF